MKKIIVIVLTLSLLISVPTFADETASSAQPASTEQTTAPQTTTTQETTAAPTTALQETTATPAAAAEATATVTAAQVTATDTTVVPTQNAGVTPDSILYTLDKLMEKIQLVLITDSVKEAAALAKIAQERLAESSAMVEKADVTLAEKALTEYKTVMGQAVQLVEKAMEGGKQVASVMDNMNDANLKDAAVVEKILSAIPEEYRAEVKVEIEKLTAALDATAETAQVVENKPDEESSMKQELTNKFIQETVKDAALIAKIKEAGLNTRQVIALISLSEQSKKPLAEVIDLFLENEKGIGATAHKLGLPTKDALKGINNSFKDAKNTIKMAFKEAIKVVDVEDQAKVEAIVNENLSGQRTAEQEVKVAQEKLEKVVKEAKVQVEAITAATAANKAQKEIEKLEKKAEKAIEKIEKYTEKNKEEAGKVNKAEDKDNAHDRNDSKSKEDKPGKSERNNK